MKALTIYRDSTVRLDDPGFEPPGRDIFPTRPDRPRGPRILLYDGYRAFFPEIKQPGRGANHPLPSTSEVRERGIIPLLPLGAFMVCYTTNSTSTLPCAMNSTNYVAKTCIPTCVTNLQQFVHKRHQGKCSLDNVILGLNMETPVL